MAYPQPQGQGSRGPLGGHLLQDKYIYIRVEDRTGHTPHVCNENPTTSTVIPISKVLKPGQQGAVLLPSSL